MGLRKTHENNETTETEGVWVEVDINDHNEQPIEVKLAYMGKSNKRYTKRLEVITKPHMAAIQNDVMPEKLSDRLWREVFTDTILLGWKNLPKSELTGNAEDTELLEYNRENALALFTELPNVLSHWEEIAKMRSTFREKVMEDAAKN